MENKIGKLNYLLISALLIIGGIANGVYLHVFWLGILVTVGYFLFTGFIVGSILIADKGWRTYFGILFSLCITILWNGIALYLYRINDVVFVLQLIVIPAFLFFPYYTIFKERHQTLWTLVKQFFTRFVPRQRPRFETLLATLYAVSGAALLVLLIRGITEETLQSPWQSVGAEFFIVYFCATAFLVAHALLSKKYTLSLGFIVVHTCISVSVAAIVYRIGYGFDPFIHQAAERVVSELGAIYPKTPYYLGQYGLVAFLHQLTALSIEVIDRWLVPLLYATCIPPLTFFVYKQWLKEKYALIISLFAIIIPFPHFIMTAPQNLANILFIAAMLMAMLYFKKSVSISALYLLAGAAAVTHPLAGIPLLICVVLFQLFRMFYLAYHHSPMLYVATAAVFVIAIPLTLIANGSGIDFKRPQFTLDTFVSWIDKYDLQLNLVYLFGLNKLVIAAAVTLLGLHYLRRHKLIKNNLAFVVAAGMILGNWFLVKYVLSFPALADNDQTSFTLRLAGLSFYAILPVFLLGFYVIVKKIWETDWFTKTLGIIFLSGIATASMYLSYPRANTYEPAKFYSVSASDIRAVQFIEERAHPNHVVLANQMIGAAAIREYGFKQYFGDEFYYSMPRGSSQSLYQAYLDMIYGNSSRKTMDTVIEKTGVEEAYFVLNAYWNNSEKIAAAVTETADKKFIIDGGKILIFRYDKSR